ncbi:cytochrome c [Propylenella binzhouense]|uniref:C-type cytochrome n=1 Tax=Propylenella binzhouense TaxID=2555902 RepID=A0A964WRY3_9HYPH|nr:cytochrome c [Propylenella binzhouense]MYZ46387.1 c-type cytochrome [Propylenella binzhouense]
MWKRLLLGLIVLVLAAGIGFFALAWRSAYDPIDPPGRTAFDDAAIARGAALAGIGDCAVCHTAAGGEAYAGGLPIPTPFGTIYSTNITPDPETGIGRWSEAAFRRSMREGVARDGSHLYPAFPYPHFTKATDEDIRAIYAFLMTREPVRAEAPANQLPFPLNFRPLMAGWNLLFLDEGPFRPDPNQSEAWNRGAYLAEGLGHCGSCHTPVNALGAERKDRRYAGGVAEGWHAPALDASSPAPMPWTEEALANYLRGWDPHHGLAAGPMAPVVETMKDAPAADIAAIATYVASLSGGRTASRRSADQVVAFAEERAFGPVPQVDRPKISAVQAEGLQDGERLFVGACATCHHEGGALPYTRPVELSFSSSVTGPDPRNLVRIVLDGIHPPEGQPGPIMPGFAGALTDQQLEALLIYVRRHFGNAPAWRELGATIRDIRGSDAS